MFLKIEFQRRKIILSDQARKSWAKYLETDKNWTWLLKIDKVTYSVQLLNKGFLDYLDQSQPQFYVNTILLFALDWVVSKENRPISR